MFKRKVGSYFFKKKQKFELLHVDSWVIPTNNLKDFKSTNFKYLKIPKIIFLTITELNKKKGLG